MHIAAEYVTYGLLQTLIMLCKVYGIELSYTLASGYNDTDYRYTCHIDSNSRKVKAELMMVKGMIAGVDAGRRVGNNPALLPMPARAIDRDVRDRLFTGNEKDMYSLFHCMRNNFADIECSVYSLTAPTDPAYNTPDEVDAISVYKKGKRNAIDCSLPDAYFKQLQAFALGFLSVR